MLKKTAFAIGLLGLTVSSLASAQDVRPGALNLQPTAPVSTALLPAPVKARVAKRNNMAPLLVVGLVVLGAGAIGGIAAAASSGSSSPG